MPGCGGQNLINALTKTMYVSQLELWVVWLDTKPAEYNKDFQNKYLNYFFSKKKSLPSISLQSGRSKKKNEITKIIPKQERSFSCTNSTLKET